MVFNFFFLPPVGTFTIADPQNWVALFAFLATALTAYNQKYLNNVLGVDPTGHPSSVGQQSLQPMFAATASYTLLDNHELGNRSLQSGGAPPNAPQGTPDPAFDVNNTGTYNNKTLAFQTIEKSYLDYHPARAAITRAPAPETSMAIR